MKVVIIKKCDLGAIGDVVDVKSGYANNCLFKQGLAVKDTDKAREEHKLLAAKKNKDKNVKNVELETAVSKIKKDSVINIHAKANEKGHLYAALNDEDLIEALTSQLGVIKGGLQIKLVTVIKELGKIKAELMINNIKKNIVINIKQLDDNQTD